MSNRGSNEAERSRRERQPVGNTPRAYVEPAGGGGDRECARPLVEQDAHEPPPTGSAGSQSFHTGPLNVPYALPRAVTIVFQAAAPAKPMKVVNNAYSTTSWPPVSKSNRSS